MLWYIFTGRDAGKEDVPLLAASVPECQEALSILLLRCGCGRSRHLVRCLLAAKGAAWLRPWLPRRILRASKHSSKAAARGGTSSLPAAFRKCYETSAIWFVYHEQNQPYDRTDSRLFYMENLYKIVPWKTQIR